MTVHVMLQEHVLAGRIVRLTVMNVPEFGMRVSFSSTARDRSPLPAALPTTSPENSSRFIARAISRPSAALTRLDRQRLQPTRRGPAVSASTRCAAQPLRKPHFLSSMRQLTAGPGSNRYGE
jgi:hypothetical protein